MDGDLKERMSHKTADATEVDAAEESAEYKKICIALGVVIIMISVSLSGIMYNIIQSMLEGSHRALPGSQLSKIMVMLLVFGIVSLFIAVMQSARLIYHQLDISVNSSTQVAASNAVQYLLFGMLIYSIYLIIFGKQAWLSSLGRIIFNVSK